MNNQPVVGRCPRCGAMTTGTTRFCNNCGSPLTIPVQQTPPTPVAPTYSAYAQPQQVRYQQPYGAAPVSGYAGFTNSTPLTVGQYIGMFILSAIPIVGFILLLVWAFSSSTNLNKKNYSRAILILGIIGVVIGIVLSILGVGVMGALGTMFTF